MQTAEQVMSEITENAKQSSPKIRNVEKLIPGLVERQGDIYLLHMGVATKSASKIAGYYEWIRKNAKPHETTLLALPKTRGKKTSVRQLAQGETQGSRHVAAGDLEVFAPVDANVLIGPTIVAEGRWTLEHPEHGHASVPAGAYQVLYQRDYDQVREELRRVQD